MSLTLETGDALILSTSETKLLQKLWNQQQQQFQATTNVGTLMKWSQAATSDSACKEQYNCICRQWSGLGVEMEGKFLNVLFG